ncbi:MAG: DUF6526 family protein [Ginsengibacter sp.]
MKEQNLKNHSRFVPLFHFVLILLIFLCFAASIWNMYRAYEHHSGRLVAAILFVLSIGLGIVTWYARAFPLVAQDRAIRAEENLRHYFLTGKPLPPGLSFSQVIALRFAEDTEFVLLAEKAFKENMSSREIKNSIANWRPDNYRV